MSPVDRDLPTPITNEEQPESSDSLLERWLARGTASQPRWRAAAGPRDEPPREQLGDDLADRWFR
jgi:hypothetical protein